MRVDTRDQLTAMNRFYNDCWSAIPADRREAGIRRIKQALRFWGAAPSQPAWERFTESVREEVGEERARQYLADFEPYVR